MADEVAGQDVRRSRSTMEVLRDVPGADIYRGDRFTVDPGRWPEPGELVVVQIGRLYRVALVRGGQRRRLITPNGKSFPGARMSNVVGVVTQIIRPMSVLYRLSAERATSEEDRAAYQELERQALEEEKAR